MIAVTGPHSVIWTISPDGTQASGLDNDPIAITEFGPSFSPDGSKILFSGYARGAVNGGANYDVYTMNADGSGIVNLTTSPTDVASWFSQMNARWSPDGTRIVYDGDDGLYVMNADGSDQTRIAKGQDGSWSPDGTAIVFVGPGSRVFSVHPDGTDIREIIDEPAAFPRWSPDGSKIAFVRNGGGVYVVSRDGSDGTLVADLHTQGIIDEPNWSPDGRTIAFDAMREGTFEIYSVLADGTGLTNLTNDSAADENDPVWSPDGSEMAFSRTNFLSTQGDNTGSFHVWVMAVDGSNPHDITPRMNVGGFWLSWQSVSTPASGSTSPVPQYTGTIDAAVGNGSDLWLVICTERCREDAGVPGAGRIQLLTGEAGVVSPGYGKPVDAIGALAYDDGDLFALGFADDTVTRLQARTGAVVWTTDLRGADTQTPDPAFLPEHVTVSADSVWVSSDRGGIVQLDRATGQLLQVVHLLPDATDDVAWGAGSLWVAEALEGAWRVSPDGQILAKLKVAGARGRVLNIGAVVATSQGVWVTGDWAKPVVDAQGTPDYEATDSFAVALIDPQSDEVVFSTELPQAAALTVVDDEPWLIGADGRTIDRAGPAGIDPIALALQPGDRAMAITSAGAWIIGADGTVSLAPVPDPA